MLTQFHKLTVEADSPTTDRKLPYMIWQNPDDIIWLKCGCTCFVGSLPYCNVNHIVDYFCIVCHKLIRYLLRIYYIVLSKKYS